MPNPYKIYDKNKGPAWLKKLDKYVEDAPAATHEARKKDNDATVRNYGGDRSAIDEATYQKGRK